MPEDYDDETRTRRSIKGKSGQSERPRRGRGHSRGRGRGRGHRSRGGIATITDDHDPQKQCCPSVTETISPLGGFDRKHRLVELYRDPSMTQKIYQTRCLANIENRPCRFIAPNLSKSTHCVQKYTYQYAIVKDFAAVHQPYRMDFIRVKSACTCELRH